MPKYSINQKANMLERANRAEQKARGYGSDARAYANSAKGGKGPLGLDYAAIRDAKNKIANAYEQEAEDLRQRAMPAPNSRAQYQAEKEAGDPYATTMSYEAWKALD